MNKKDRLLDLLTPIFEKAIRENNSNSLYQFLIQNCELPGRRANLELAHAFSICVMNDKKALLKSAKWQLLEGLVSVSEAVAPVNSPKEFLPFSGYIGMGGFVKKNPEYLDKVLQHYKNAAVDGRWRVREAIAQGTKYFIADHADSIFIEFKKWVDEHDFMLIRGALAGLAIPSFLEDQKYSVKLLDLLGDVITIVQQIEEVHYKDDKFIILEKGLKFIISVAVASNPRYGFELMFHWTDGASSKLTKILMENCKKARIAKKFPQEVQAVMKILKSN
ncbi:hypothetical protein NEF87_003149 [Candidatus Lokiarchaeum ossiferum]|uniref:Uncharacterized protein n=1 Tax=Candidatus Lokiarchaeum ossiferum TaxID=2951803 RepID=A0ABY6HWD2_9ARCH|nr:hypothetical protein NEF87_003149 [Candidatus Lokiarchaeum sp. B-35]